MKDRSVIRKMRCGWRDIKYAYTMGRIWTLYVTTKRSEQNVHFDTKCKKRKALIDNCTTLSTADLNLVMFWYIGLKCSENIAKIEDC